MALVDECRWVARLILHSFDPSPTDFTRKTVAFRSADKMARQDAIDDARLDLIDDGDSEAIADLKIEAALNLIAQDLDLQESADLLRRN